MSTESTMRGIFEYTESTEEFSIYQARSACQHGKLTPDAMRQPSEQMTRMCTSQRRSQANVERAQTLQCVRHEAEHAKLLWLTVTPTLPRGQSHATGALTNP